MNSDLEEELRRSSRIKATQSGEVYRKLGEYSSGSETESMTTETDPRNN